MKKLFSTLLFISGLLASSDKVMACYANFTHTNACAGDTIWVYGADTYAVQFWDFGDTTAGNPNVAYSDTAYHIYNTPGTYYITHFVNIGAQWAFQIDEISVGTDCYNASFTAACNGSQYMTFTNTSTGNSTYYFWDYGDPASGFNNDYTVDGYHYYAQPGSYTVTLIISDGTNTDTSIQIVNVDSTCLSATFSYGTNTCLGDNTNFNVNFSSNVSSVLWDFGDPASGAANSSTSFMPTHIYSQPGFYVGHVTYSDGISSGSLQVYAYVTDCSVWAGDANRDAQVSPEDIFPIGLYYGMSGVQRAGASQSFTSQAASDWANLNGMPYMYLQDVVNFKHADCNGDGVIDKNDLTAITQNMSRKHSGGINMLSYMQDVPANAPAFRIQLPATSVSGVNTATLTLGTASNPTTFVYGYAVSIPYDVSQINPNTLSVDFSNNWMDDGAAGHSNLLTWSYNDEVNHVLHIAAVRNNQAGIMGHGTLAQISYQLQPGASGTLNMNILPTAKLMTNSVTEGGNTGNVQHFIKANLEGSSSAISVGVKEIKNIASSVKIVPIPASTQIVITTDKTEKVTAVRLLNLVGQEVWEGNSSIINVSELPNGNYWLSVQTNTGKQTKQVQVMH